MLGRAASGLTFESLDFLLDLARFARELLGLLRRLLDVALAASTLIAFEPLLRLAQPFERGLRLCARRPGPLAAASFIAFAASCSCRSGVAESCALLVARELLEPTRRFFDFLRELPLRVAAAAAARALAARRHSPLPLGLLLLPARQLLQLLDQFVDAAVLALLLGALLHLVLVRQLVHLELEQVGEVFGHLVWTPPPPPPPFWLEATCIS